MNRHTKSYVVTKLRYNQTMQCHAIFVLDTTGSTYYARHQPPIWDTFGREKKRKTNKGNKETKRRTEGKEERKNGNRKKKKGNKYPESFEASINRSVCSSRLTVRSIYPSTSSTPSSVRADSSSYIKEILVQAPCSQNHDMYYQVHCNAVRIVDDASRYERSLVMSGSSLASLSDGNHDNNEGAPVVGDCLGDYPGRHLLAGVPLQILSARKEQWKGGGMTDPHPWTGRWSSEAA